MFAVYSLMWFLYFILDVSVINDPTLPPPSYEDVTGKTVPTAPPMSEYYKKYSSAP